MDKDNSAPRSAWLTGELNLNFKIVCKINETCYNHLLYDCLEIDLDGKNSLSKLWMERIVYQN